MKRKNFSFFIHFDDGDPAGILFFAHFFKLAHRALELNLEEGNIPWREWYDHEQWGVPLRHVESDFRHPVRPGDRVTVWQGVRKLGESSVVLESEFQNADGKICAIVKTTHVFIDKSTLQKMKIPKHLRDFLEPQLLID